jgi:hypothetical protein
MVFQLGIYFHNVFLRFKWQLQAKLGRGISSTSKAKVFLRIMIVLEAPLTIDMMKLGLKF